MAQSQSSRRLPPPAWFLLALSAQRLLTARRRSSAGSRVAAAGLVLGSSSLAVSAVSTMLEAKTQLNPEHPERSRQLLTAGPFRHSRNPIYVALAGLLLAHAVWRRSWRALLPVVGFVGVIDRTQIPAEERALAARFKRRYERYRASTPRWLGRR